ncbi:coiled-coil domain-containing protein 22 homolog isoform X3 [Carica papaya]|uniref:coiled-coil domain-containing protein 22 homolog isoform X3 n=1 Tax=Carica papaya TaxID=3649 RepID=UPI000B8CF99C|nr:coiled-coil domain-containing protein 22 homolog isoform X3 [Carica papaya]XP_021906114.1 coiled-coil domain-containing protein 22 homolog isoform X3 [Carica papaya]
MCSLRQFLYPSEEDLYKLVRFLVERLSESPEGVKTSRVDNVDDGKKMKKETSEENMKKTDNEAVDLNLQKVEDVLKDLILTSEVPDLSNYRAGDATINGSFDDYLFSEKMEELDVQNASCSKGKILGQNEHVDLIARKALAEQPGNLRAAASGNQETSAQVDGKQVSLFEETVTYHEDPYSKVLSETRRLRNEERVLQEEVMARTAELCCLEEELECLKAAADLAFDNSHPVEFYLKQLNEQLDAGNRDLEELESKWEASRQSLEEKKRSLEESLYADKPEAKEKLQKLRELELEKQFILSEIRKREEEESKLRADLEKQTEVASRRSYIEQIKEITKNSRKLDADIERILRETRELQLESNSIQERLHRTYSVVDEMVLRETKRDPVGKQAYRLLTSIHESFGQIAEKILVTDRVRREGAEHEKKLAAMASRSLNIAKLKADLDAITRENEYLEKHQQEI